MSGDHQQVQKVVVEKGYVPVEVMGANGEESERFVVSVKLFNHPRIVSLLEIAAQEFGYEQRGVLRIPCSVEHFRRVIQLIMDAE